jgi:hypothetical protein
VPYVNQAGEVKRGILITALQLQGDRLTAAPTDHVIHFAGEYPCDHQGVRLDNLVNNSTDTTLVDDIISNHTFSHKPPAGYPDYHAKVTRYVEMLTHHAQAIDSSVSAQTFKRIEAGDTSTVFNYPDTNAARAEIVPVVDKLAGQKIVIVGLGGTGSYVLDFVSKIPVGEIHLYDKDDLLTHNAYRAPGAIEVEELQERQKKVSYHAKNYSAMHRNIVKHEYNLTVETISELSGADFVFLCIDSDLIKKAIVEKLVADGIPFVDTGIGMQAIAGKLRGSVRSTLATPAHYDHLDNTLSFSGGKDNIYAKNIQIAEINAFNAALAVMQWKKHFGYYHNLIESYNIIYNIDNSQLLNA